MLAVEAIKKTAATQSQLPAVINNGAVISYGQFWRDIARAAANLALNLKGETGLAAIRMRDDYAEFVMIMAAHLCGCATVCLAPNRPFGRMAERLGIRFHVTDGERQGEAPAAERPFRSIVLKVGAPLPDDAQKPDVEAMACPIAPDALMHVKITSGTTGEPKLVPLTRAQFEHWIGCYARVVPKTRRARYLAISGPFQGLGLSRAMSAWERGDVVIIERRISSYEAVALYQPDEFVATPVFLYQFLRNMPPQYQPRNRPQIQIASGKLSARLHQRAVERLGCEIICSYGMSERGTIGYSFGVEPGPEWIDRYRVVPWARVEIVDEKDAVQPEGSRGFVRVRSEGMPQTYIGDEALAERNLRDGWYYTGDIGVLHPGGILQIEGRENELINLSGVKIYHPKIEDDLQHIEGVTDAAVFSAPNRAGIEELCLAVVAPLEGRADIAARLREYIQRALSTLDGRHLIFVDAIPRNDSGKVMRRELIETFRQMREQREQRRAAAA